MNDFDTTKCSLLDELTLLKKEEDRIDAELNQYFGMIAGSGSNMGSSSKSNLSFDSLDIATCVQKIGDNFAPTYEAMQQDAKKLVAQVEDCRALSERLSMIVRRLDNMQIRSQQALACTEDIINLKDCKVRIIAAIEEKNLSQAVGYLRQVHEIDLKAAMSSDDYEVIREKEQEIKDMVKKEFASAIEDSNLKSVMALCPLLQTLGLESEARDNFLQFMERTVFIAVSADAGSVEGATDPATGYAQSLSSVFNSAFIIIQQYLPMVIQGMENSLGDVHFLRRLHKQCEKQAGLVLKRYMKYRNIREVATTLRAGNPAGPKQVAPAELHSIMDELALLIQYCCKYAKFLRHVCKGAETKLRNRAVQNVSLAAQKPSATTETTTAAVVVVEPAVSREPSTEIEAVVVFSGPSDFDKMIDELINRYYMEGEQWLMRAGVQAAIPQSLSTSQEALSEEVRLDECFFVLQKCSLRAIATNNIHAACAILHHVSDLISSDLLVQANALMSNSVAQLSGIMKEHIIRFNKSIGSGSGDPSQQESSSTFSLAAALTGGGSSSSSSTVGAAGIQLREEGGFSLIVDSSSSGGAGAAAGSAAGDHGVSSSSGSIGSSTGFHAHGSLYDPWHTAHLVEAFNIIELCVRYTDRLNKDVYTAGQTVFAASAEETTAAAGALNAATAHAAATAQAASANSAGTSAGGHSAYVPIPSASSELDKLKLCKEDFEAAKVSFANALRQGADQLVSVAQSLMRDILQSTIGRSGPLGGVKFDERDETFEAQAALDLLPRILTLPIETLVNICTFHMSERNKDMVVGMLADTCCDRLEQFISQTNFRFAGALKLEEIVRGISSLFSRFSSVPVRGRFSRLREVMLVLTADNASSSALLYDSLSQLTTSEAEAFLALRIDSLNG